ncbi:MAG: ABC transporter ATP-binding protein [Deinococcota bacterium]
MNVILRGLGYLSPYRWLAIGAFVSMVLVTATNLAVPQLFQQLIDNGIEGQNWNAIATVTIFLLIIAVVRGVFSFTNTFWSQKASQGIAFDIRNEVYIKLETLSFSYHDSHNVGQLMTRTTSDVEGVQNFFATGLLQLIAAIITFAGSIIILLLTDWRLTLAVLAVIPLIVLIFLWLFGRMGPLYGRVQKNLGILNNILQENIEGVRVVKSFTAEPYEAARYGKQNQVLLGENINVVNTFSTGFPTVFLLSNLATLIVIWFGGNRVISEQLSLGTLVAFNSYLAFLVQPIFQVGFVSQQLARAQASGERIFEVVDAQSDISNPQDARDLSEDTAGNIFFKDVHFHYPNKAEGTLYDLNLEIPAGATVALVGPTGSGKSSLINLIPRYYDITEGSVEIDGHDVRGLELNSLRQQVSVVLQNVRLMSGTVRENISYGKADASKDDVINAAKIAQAHDFIIKLPDGYDSEVGESGGNLSGGQRQRIAIARTLLAHPRILIFDDSMSALDAETEVKLHTALKPYLEEDQHTTIIIAQRVSTLLEADFIVVMDKGRVVAQGKHADLLASSPLYADIVSSQLEGAA